MREVSTRSFVPRWLSGTATVGATSDGCDDGTHTTFCATRNPRGSLCSLPDLLDDMDVGSWNRSGLFSVSAVSGSPHKKPVSELGGVETGAQPPDGTTLATRDIGPSDASDSTRRIPPESYRDVSPPICQECFEPSQPMVYLGTPEEIAEGEPLAKGRCINGHLVFAFLRATADDIALGQKLAQRYGW